MRKIAKVQTSDRILNQLQSNIAYALNPILTNPATQGRILRAVALKSGANVVQHGLGAPLTGWIPVRIRGAATLYDTQDSNQTPSSTLLITSSAAVTVDLYVF